MVADGRARAVVQLHALLAGYPGVLDEHPKLCAGQQTIVPHAVAYVSEVEGHYFGAIGAISFCVI